MNNIYQSATLKLTGWYLCLVMSISVVFSCVIYYFATNALAGSLAAQTRRIYQLYPVFSDDRQFVSNPDLTHGAHQILFDLLYFNLLVLVVAGFASYWLAQRTLRPIQASNETQKRFVADASHELRTPVTSLKMSSEVALSDPSLSKEALRDILKSNLEEADKLDVLLSNLLRLSQLESLEIRDTFEAVSVKDIADEAVERIKKPAELKHVTITNEVGAQTVQGDRDSLVQLVVILLDNAIKYSPEKSKINLTSQHHKHETTISVIDHGLGIEPQALEHVFDRFYRADEARSGSNGFGLGLSIAQHIADLHEGSITLTSAVSKGTKAIVHIPNQTDQGSR
jgi:two-component system, OmpR family, sensor histidine kinase CiaH